MNESKVSASGKQAAPLYQRVHYVQGLMLTADDFAQDQRYFMAHDHLHNRLLHGCGTVCGLKVHSTPSSDQDPGITVEPGVAVSPSGKVIQVPQAQQASVSSWLARHRELVQKHLEQEKFPGRGHRLILHVGLSYRENPLEMVPLLDPTDPATTTHARIADDFVLDLQLDAIPHLEEQLTRRLVALLRSFQVADAPGPFLQPEQIAELVRALPTKESIEVPAMQIHPEHADLIRQTAFRVWVTEVRPQIVAGGCAGTTDADGVLLASLSFGLNQALQVSTPIQIDESQRPILLNTRLQQAWLEVSR